MTFNMREIRKEIKDKEEILNPTHKFKVWEAGVPEDSNVTYFKLETLQTYDNKKEVGLIIVDYLGNKVHCGKVLVIRADGELNLMHAVNLDSGLKLSELNQIVVKD